MMKRPTVFLAIILAVAIIGKADKTGITAASKSDGREHRGTTKSIPEMTSREPHALAPGFVTCPRGISLSALHLTPHWSGIESILASIRRLTLRRRTCQK